MVMMTIKEAEKLIGHKVVYRSVDGRIEEGVITSVNRHFVSVRYGGDMHSKATLAKDLEVIR